MVKDEECKLKHGKDATFKQIKIGKTIQAVKSLKQLTVQTGERKPSSINIKKIVSLETKYKLRGGRPRHNLPIYDAVQRREG